MRYLKQNPKLIRYAVVVLILLILGWLSQMKSTQKLQYKDVNYFGSEIIGQNGVLQKITGAIKLHEINQSVELNYLEADFEFSNFEPTFSYGNLFQTDDSIYAIRMELQPRNNLVLILGEGRLYQLSDAIGLGLFYKIRFLYERGKVLKVFIDEREVLNIVDQALLNSKFDFSKMHVGTGLARQRTLLGVVKNFESNSTYTYSNPYMIFFKWVYVLLSALTFLYALTCINYGGENVSSNSSKNSSTFIDNIANFGIAIGCIFLALCLIKYLGAQYIGHSKWLALLVLPISIVVITFFSKSISSYKLIRSALVAIFIGYASYIIFITIKKPLAFDGFSYILIFTSGFALFFSIKRDELILKLGIDNFKLDAGLCLGLTILFILIAWSSLTDLLNWRMFLLILDYYFSVTILGSFLIIGLIFYVLITSPRINISNIKRFNLLQKLPGKITENYLDIVVITLFVWISFRHDTLFLGSSALHWEYFVGVIQSVKNGGWLLWDTPSQYGFLNILLASLVPGSSAWQSFYVFQGLLLFLVSVGLYLTSTRLFQVSIFQRISIFAIIFMAIFFADPDLIGPYLYPSSSVVRFFCVYLMLLAVCWVPMFGLHQAIIISIVWSLGVIWSAESALYVSGIFFFIVFAIILRSVIRKNRSWLLALKYILLGCTSLSLLMAIIVAFYTIRLGMLPDIYGFFEYAFGYAGGYGYTPFPLSGPGNFLLLVFISISLICIEIIQCGKENDESILAPLAGMAGCIWAISTYYIGRPYPQNVTAILPLVYTVIFFTLMISKRANLAMLLMPIKAAAIPVIFIILIPLCSARWISTMLHAQSFTSDLTTKLPKANDELKDLLSIVKPSVDTRLVYYGDDAVPPILGGEYSRLNETNWLPIPLQLLEEPITEIRRGVYIKRFICRNQPSKGIIIFKKDDAHALRLQGFLRELSNFYTLEEVVSGKVFKIYRATDINLQECPLFMGNKTS